MYLRNHSLMTMLTPKKTNTKTTMGTTLNLGSWNSRGHGPDRLIYIEHLLQKCNILLIQEHWLFDSELSKLAYNSSTEITVMGSSGMDPEKLLVGRPYGGCALLYKTCLRCSITPIPVVSRRIFACIIDMVEFPKFILINAYMPCDSHNIVLNDEYKEILNDVESVIVLHHEIDHVIIGGDLNTDISRVRSVHSAMLKEFCTRLSLRFCLSSPKNTVGFTYNNEATGAQSVLDHFIVSENLFGSIESSYSCLHEGDNLSDHLPVCLNLDVKASFAPQSNAHALNRPSWQRATVQDKAAYQLRLKELLREVDIPFDVFSCRPFECVCQDHGRMIEQYYSDVMSAMITASKECIPSRSKKKAAWWSTYVSHLQEESIFWHRIWLSSGRPRTGWVQDIRKKTRAQYKRISSCDASLLCMLGAPLSSFVQDQWKRSVSDGEAALASAVAELRDVVRGHLSSILSIAEARRLLLEKKRGKRWTYQDRCTGTKRQLGYILVRRKWRNSVLNAEPYSSFCSVGSDHRVVSMKVRLSLRAPKTNPRIVYDWKTFAADSEMQEKYTVEVRNRFQILEDEEDPSSRYQRFIEANMEATRTCVPRRKRVKASSSSKHPDIVQAREKMEEASRKLEETGSDENGEQLKEAKELLFNTYDRLKEEKAIEACDRIQAAHGDGRYSEAWKVVNEMTEKKKAKEGQVAGASPEERVATWFTHFKNLLGTVPSEENSEGNISLCTQTLTSMTAHLPEKSMPKSSHL
ncbi:hypothetical protein CAPTEDRAFT_218117 [Capitella teleta]|uniref:Endonuclease/exonuclease/phosphatase domain-containing protein n=1 Tax=Capitella teleta TaxID=283909 RepID=R7UE50_CAPTE|nr:hypothetical protein CAPTEDRAFT_218117 [Capitella teleta]|eukprot:ELU02058.1 hypothetical protein CAPTEDRAFT_218117 [Capitella teleta]